MLRVLFPPIPLFFRLSTLILLVCTVVTFAIVGLVRALNPDPACLVIENFGRVTVDPYSNHSIEDFQVTGRFSTTQAANPPAVSRFNMRAESPDRWHYALLSAQRSDQIEVRQNNTRPLFYNIRSDRAISDAYLQWSPDGQRIAFIDEKRTLRIADAHGKVLRSMQAPAGADSFYLDSWSADSRYLAVLMFFGESSLHLQLLDTETLSPVLPKPLSVGTSCISSGDGNATCFPWAAAGAHASYIEDGEWRSESVAWAGNLVLVNAGKIVQTFALPDSRVRTVAKSVDGHLVAVVSFPTGGYTDNTEGRLDIYGEDGTAITGIDTVAYTGLGGADATPTAIFDWSPDNHTLIYFRHDPATPQNMQLMRYDLLSRTTQVLLTIPSDREFTTSFSTDGALLAVRLLYDLNFAASGDDAWIIRLSDGHTISFTMNAQESTSFAWKGHLLAYPAWDFGQRLTFINMVDENGKLLRRYPLPSHILDSLYWSNCQ